MGTTKLTSKQVWLNFRDNYFFYLDEEAPFYRGKTAGQFKMLVEEQGLKTTNDLLEYVCKNWKDIKKKYKRIGSSLPSMGLIYGYRQSFIGDMRESNKKPKRSFDDETDTAELYLDS